MTKRTEEIMDRWNIIHQNTAQIARAMAYLWHIDEPLVEFIVNDELHRRQRESD